MPTTILGSLPASLGAAAGSGLEAGVKSGLENLSKERLLRLQQTAKLQQQQQEQDKMRGGLRPLLIQEGFTPDAADKFLDFFVNSKPPVQARALENIDVFKNMLGVSDASPGQQESGAEQIREMRNPLSSLEQNMLEQAGQDLRAVQDRPASDETPQEIANRDKTPGLAAGFKSAEDRRHAERQNLEERKFDLKEQELLQKHNAEARKFIEPFSKQAMAAQDRITDSDVILNLLDKEKNITGPVKDTLIKTGLFKYFASPSQQTMQKMLENLKVQNLANLPSGTRPNMLIEGWIAAGTPGMANTPEALRAMVNLQKNHDEFIIKYRKAATEVVRNNNGKAPFDADEQMAELVKDDIQALAEKNQKIIENLSGKKFDFNERDGVVDVLEEVDERPTTTKIGNEFVDDDGTIWEYTKQGWVKVS